MAAASCACIFSLGIGAGALAGAIAALRNHNNAMASLQSEIQSLMVQQTHHQMRLERAKAAKQNLEM